LEADGVPIVAAFWQHPTAETGWRLIIASPSVEKDGAMPIYRRVQDALQQMPETPIRLGDIYAVGDRDPLVVWLRSSIPSDFPLQGLDVTVPLANYSSYAPDEAALARLHIHRLARPDVPAPSGGALVS